MNDSAPADPTAPTSESAPISPEVAAELTELAGGPIPPAPKAPTPPSRLNTNRFRPGQVPRVPAAVPTRKLGASFAAPSVQVQRMRERIAKCREQLTELISVADKRVASVRAIVAELTGFDGGKEEMARLEFDHAAVLQFLDEIDAAVTKIEQ